MSENRKNYGGDDIDEFPNVYESFSSRLHPDDVEETSREIQSHLERDALYDIDYRLRSKDGSYRWFHARGDSVRDESGTVTRMSGSISDIDERVEVERLNRLTFDSSTSGLLIVARGGRIEQANPAMLKITGYEAQELIDQPVEILLPLRFQQQHPSLRDEFWSSPTRRGMADDREVALRRRNGEERIVQIGLSPIETSKSQVVLVSVTDITALKRTEQRLKRQSTVLRLSNAELEQFAYVASHDLQEPLRAISGYIQLLELDYSDAFDETAADYMSRTVGGVKRMQTLINDLLDYSRVARKGATFKPVDLNACVTEARALLEFSINETSATIDVEELPVVQGDRSQLIRLLQNLISNSIKYRGPEAPLI